MVLWRKFLYCEWQPKKKKRTDEPKTLWQSRGFTGFSSLKQHRLSRHAGGEQIWSSAWWSDYHKLPILIFFFLACLPFTVCYKPFCIWYSVTLFSPSMVLFGFFCTMWNQRTLIQSAKKFNKACKSSCESLKKHRIKYQQHNCVPHLFHPVTAS